MGRKVTLEYKELLEKELGPLPEMSLREYRKRFTKGFQFTHCQRGHELIDENVRVDPRTGYRICKTCTRARSRIYQRMRYKKNPKGYAKKRHEYDLKWKYGISVEEKNAMLEKQNYRCANKGCLADKPMAARNQEIWLVDHDHKTGKVRGLLCNTCNLALGSMQDDIGKLQGLIDYLRENANG